MILSQFAASRSNFFSTLESIAPLNLVGQDIAYNMTLKLRNLKALYSYASAVHLREPILLGAQTVLLKHTVQNFDEVMSFSSFLENTVVNNRKSFYFQATTFAHRDSLTFTDKALIGNTNIYKPSGHSTDQVIDSMLTCDLEAIRSFSDLHTKLGIYKGIVSFDRGVVLNKGHTINLIDKNVFLIIISAKHDLKKGYSSYLALLTQRD